MILTRKFTKNRKQDDYAFLFFQSLAIIGFVLFVTGLYVQSNIIILIAALFMSAPFIRNVVIRIKNGETIKALLAVAIVILVGFIAIRVI